MIKTKSIAEDMIKKNDQVEGTERTRVLVVDDDPQICWSLSTELTEEGYIVDCCGNGLEALTRIKEKKYDVVITDVVMPGLDGLEVLQKIRDLYPSMPVLMLSGHADFKMAVEAMRHSAFDFLTKPLNIDVLKISLRNSLRRHQLEDQVKELTEFIGDKLGRNLIWNCRKMKAVEEAIRNVAGCDVDVLVLGEHGTGKELVARRVHALSARVDRPFMVIDCATLPSNLVESEIFGYEKGAFTGAVAPKKGRFEAAEGGTVFLDEIANLDMGTQAKLLRVLQEKEVTRIGGIESKKLDLRIIAATNADLSLEICAGRFREDLFYRLNGFTIDIPPLRERGGDIKMLAEYFIRKYTEEYKKEIAPYDDEIFEGLMNAQWPGNVRQLENAMKRLVITGRGKLTESQLRKSIKHSGGVALSRHCNVLNLRSGESMKEARDRIVTELEKSLIQNALESTKWHKKEAAKKLKVDYKTLYNKIKDYKLE